MADLSELLFHTEEFFKRHWWCPDETTSPIWKYNYTWDGAVPYHDLGGVYALINEHQEIVYIGLGSSRGGRKYKEHGISRRLLKHVIKRNPAEDGKRYVTKPKWTL